MAVYTSLYESSSSVDSPSSITTSTSPAEVKTSTSSHADESSLPDLEFGPFPVSLNDLLNNRIHLNRLLGLSNLHYIDPDDGEVTQELMQVRTSFAKAIFDCPEDQLEKFWSTAIGDRYWALVRSGIQKFEISSEDQFLKEKSTTKLDPSQNGGFGTPGSTNAFIVALMYYVPGSVKVDDPSSKIPSWLLSAYKDIFEA